MAIELKANGSKATLTAPVIDITEQVEQTYNAESKKAQSGTAVAEAVAAEKEQRQQADINLNTKIDGLETDLQHLEHDVDGAIDTVNSFNSDMGELFNRVNALEQNGYEIIAETTLTEPAAQIVWTKDKDGNSLTKYSDFFIFWNGAFTNTANEGFFCNGENGHFYFNYNYPTRKTDKNGGWFEVRELYSEPGVMQVYLGTSPQQLCTNISAGTLNAQGLADNCKLTVTDISCRLGESAHPISNIRFGSPSTATSLLTAGTKAVLFGRKRQ